MDLNYLEKLLKLFDESTLTELEIEEEGTQVKLSRQKEQPQMMAPMQFAMPPMQPAYGAPPQASAPAPAAAPAKADAPAPTGAAYHEVKSPIVGTFYRAPAPDADSYVQVGQSVQVGTTLCIIEAMKLMNEIESDAAGKIVKILIENGQPVEYGQVLMLIEP
ncbi:MAG TPA: acetyl-CoA carboxylase biotin carboxyl carrier protein [Candidatus Kapabacteria bacterium]|jgi:acetyl-CoA carboxylase biotin carboxyl carrier protein|nr:acetyl-CoA carboxylase biotin carboxyl carrier protein [Candidatus Kapabacteria bacterium]